MSKLQDISRIKTWIIYYTLQSIRFTANSAPIMSNKSYALKAKVNSLLKELRKSIEKDYQVYKTQTLERRKLEKEKLKCKKIK